jgi:hypothetical protein
MLFQPRGIFLLVLPEFTIVTPAAVGWDPQQRHKMTLGWELIGLKRPCDSISDVIVKGLIPRES